ncbi:MAG: hypothetical protein CMJ78_24775 [Planctomycetaceae bacterium]|nr:hypothetical protein [Planctomycetaceae bacterium]
MQNTVLKLTALFGVIALGVLVTLQAQRELEQHDELENVEIPVSPNSEDGSSGFSTAEFDAKFNRVFDNQNEPTGSPSTFEGVRTVNHEESAPPSDAEALPGFLAETPESETISSSFTPPPKTGNFEDARPIPAESEEAPFATSETETETAVKLPLGETTSTETEVDKTTDPDSALPAVEESAEKVETVGIFNVTKPIGDKEESTFSETETEKSPPPGLLPIELDGKTEATAVSAKDDNTETEITTSKTEESESPPFAEPESPPFAETEAPKFTDSETPNFDKTSTTTKSKDVASTEEELKTTASTESKPATLVPLPGFAEEEVSSTEETDTKSKADSKEAVSEPSNEKPARKPFVLDLGEEPETKESNVEKKAEAPPFGGVVDLNDPNATSGEKPKLGKPDFEKTPAADESEAKPDTEKPTFADTEAKPKVENSFPIKATGNEEPTSETPKEVAPTVSDAAKPLLPAPENLELTSPAKNTGNLQPTVSTSTGIRKGTLLPKMKIEKKAPKSAILGRPMIYTILVSNQGDSPAHQVVVEDIVPKGVKLVGTIPQAELTGNRLIWRMGTIPTDDERKIAVKVVPIAQGSIGSVATVNFVAEVASKTLITAPKIALQMTAPRASKVGELVVLHFELSNTGATAAENVVLRNVIPASLSHPSGNDLEYPIGKLAVGETRKIKLSMNAIKPGSAVNEASVTADGGLSASAQARIEIDGQLIVKRDGPAQREIGRATEFTNTVTNMSGARLRSIKVTEVVPAGMEFVKASHGGRFDPNLRQVSWQLDEIEPREAKRVKVILVPRTTGAKKTQIKVADSHGSHVTADAVTKINGIPSLALDVTQAKAAVSRGDEVSVRLKIRNRGSNADSNVVMKVTIPEQLKFERADGPVRHTVRGDTLIFEPLEELDDGDEVRFDLQLSAHKAGDARIQFEVQSDHFNRPLAREEAILVYAD